MTRGLSVPSADVFARTVHMVVERHYFGETRSASLATVQTEADKAVLALTKRLVKSPETAAIRQRDAQFRAWLRTVATPFRAGVWLVPVGLIERVEAEARRWVADRDRLADAAAVAYPGRIEEMREPLGPLFNPMDYPPTDRFRADFWVAFRFIDFGVPNVLREIRADVWERERVKLEEARRQAREVVEQHLAGSLLRITDHVVDLLRPRANGRRPALREGALDDLLTFLDLAPLRDVTNFEGLQRAVEQLRRAADGLSVEGLRDSDELRDRTAAAVAAARDVVAGLVTEDTRRAIRVREEDEGV